MMAFLIEWLYDRKNAKQQAVVVRVFWTSWVKEFEAHRIHFIKPRGQKMATLHMDKLAFLRISPAPEPYVAPPLREVNDVG